MKFKTESVIVGNFVHCRQNRIITERRHRLLAATCSECASFQTHRLGSGICPACDNIHSWRWSDCPFCNTWWST